MTTTIIEQADALSKEIEARRAEYHAKVDTAPRGVLEPLTAGIAALQEKRRTLLAAGADKCPDCGTVFGMLKVPEIRDSFGNLKSGAVYEVGCMCPAETDPETKVKTIWGGQGPTPELAAKAWNEDRFVRKRA